jgi:hypothetical protein
MDEDYGYEVEEYEDEEVEDNQDEDLLKKFTGWSLR